MSLIGLVFQLMCGGGLCADHFWVDRGYVSVSTFIQLLKGHYGLEVASGWALWPLYHSISSPRARGKDFEASKM